jgi:hypothetical protein
MKVEVGAMKMEAAGSMWQNTINEGGNDSRT